MIDASIPVEGGMLHAAFDGAAHYKIHYVPALASNKLFASGSILVESLLPFADLFPRVRLVQHRLSPYKTPLIFSDRLVATCHYDYMSWGRQDPSNKAIIPTGHNSYELMTGLEELARLVSLNNQ